MRSKVVAVVLVMVAVSSSYSPRVGAAPGFTDVPETHAFFEDIAWMADQGITDGYPDGTYRPTASVTRQAMAAFLHRLWRAEGASDPDPVPDPGFTDVPADHRFHADIAWMAELDITQGYADGGFRPDAPVTRQAMAAFLHRFWLALGQPDPVPLLDPGFHDVDPGHPFFADIAWMAQSGVTTGYPDGRFRPASPITRQAMAAFLHRLSAAAGFLVDDAGDTRDAAPGDGRCLDASGACTLRAAIDEANALDGPDTIRMLPDVDPVLAIPGADENANATGDLDVLDDLTIVGNGATIDAGGLDRVFDHRGGTLVVSNATITGGVSPTGGGLRVDAGRATIRASTVTGNESASGGGIHAATSAILTVERSTISANVGAGVATSGTTAVTASTIADNDAPLGSGLRRSGGTTTLRGTVITGEGIDCVDPLPSRVPGGIVSAGHNLDSDGTCGLDAVGDISAQPAQLGALGDNGGPTATHLAASTSPARDAIPPGTPVLCPAAGATDQRGVERPVGAGCDIGSVEGSSAAVVVPLSLVVDTADDANDALPGDGSCDTGSGACTLRAAISEANAWPGHDTITIADGVDPVLALAGRDEDANATGDLDVLGHLTVIGGGAVVDAAGIDRAFDQQDDLLELVDLTVTGGYGSYAQLLSGGGIRQRGGTLALSGVEVTGNQAVNGGGLEAIGGVTTLTDTLVGANTAAGAGGGLRQQYASAHAPNRATVTDSTISENVAGYDGGAVDQRTSALDITASVVEGNTTTSSNTGGGGAFYQHDGEIAVTDTAVAANTTPSAGGALRSEGGTFTAHRSLLTGNTAKSGGAIWSWGAVTIVDSTVSDNTADGRGGALGVTGNTVVIASTLAGNTGADGSAIHWFGGLQPTSKVHLVGSIIEGAGVLCTAITVEYADGQFASGGFNIASDASCRLGAATDLPSTDAVLGPLADNGGPTQSHFPGPTSPAIDAVPSGTTGLCPGLGTDQRGVARPAGAACDIGAVEQ